MTCQECELALGGDQWSSALDEHLRECPSCYGLFGDLRANAEAFESMSAEEMPRVRVKVKRPVWPAAVALATAAAVAVAVIFFSAPVREEPLPPARYALAPMKFEIPPMRPPAPRHRAAAPKQARASQPLMVKMLTDDPNVIIYWQIDADQEGPDK